MIKRAIIEILNEIDEDIVMYEGENLLDDGIIDSFTIVEIVTEISEKLKVNIDPDDITEINFKTVDSIIKLVENLMSENK